MADIRTVRDMNGLITYFSENLGWEIDLNSFDDIEDISYEFDAQDIGLKDEAFAKIASMRQLQPMVNDQQWGIFCIEFESHKFEPTALRKILSGLVPRRRASVDHAMWQQQDLLFICNWGEGNNRTIGLAHFEDKEKGLPQIKMISCDPSVEDFTQIKQFEDSLKQLSWPRDPANMKAWRDQWSNAFSVAYREVIQTSSMLTIRLAAEAQNIRNLVLDVLKVENEQGYVHKLYEKFRQALIHDMTEMAFADMYAQTVVYGLFSARCMDTTQEDFSVREAVTCIPNTNPFLRELMRECLGADSRDGDFMGADKRLYASFDELDIGNVVDLLAHTNTDAIIRDFNRQTGGGKEDPIIHFYEEFLTAYDKQQKVQRGVFYTPQPVVSFMVRAVDDILKKEFGYEDGLASIETKSVEITRKSKKKNDRGFYYDMKDAEEVPAVQVLDPATGTGTFLRQVILQIYENFKAKHAGESDVAIKAAWNEYVPKHLLPRINGFELMMAPYAVAHMKLAMVLHDTGYEFGTDARLNVCLTNTLEPPGDAEDQISFFNDPLAMESIQANKVKRNSGISVVIGNPPYSGESANKGEYIMSLMEDYKKEPGGLIKLQEQNSKWINDDYVKFIRFAQSELSTGDRGIVAYINPHGFVDNPTFRGMRWALLNQFKEIYILDLHGNAKKKETSPDGSKDENVFDIQQGVCILIGIKGIKKSDCIVHHADIFGLRQRKYDLLHELRIQDVQWDNVFPAHPNYIFIQQDEQLVCEWNRYARLEDVFPVNGVGICSKRDPIAYHDNKSDLIKTLKDFEQLTEDEIKSKYDVKSESRDQKVSYAKENVATYGIKDKYLQQCLYRPFDLKWTYYTDKVRGFLAYPVYKVLSNMLHDNIGLIVSRQGQASDLSNWNVVFATDKIVDLNVFRRGGGCLFPLYLYEEQFGGLIRKVNISNEYIKQFAEILSLQYDDSGLHNHDVNGFTPDDYWNYVYAILHSCVYRQKYKKMLDLDFPRIPFIKNKEHFKALVELGNELREVHTMHLAGVDQLNEVSLSEGSNTVERVVYKDNRVYINNSQYFSLITEEQWTFQIGGYQPLEKWLKDRKGKTLVFEDVKHYTTIVCSISKTVEIMERIDEIVQYMLM